MFELSKLIKSEWIHTDTTVYSNLNFPRGEKGSKKKNGFFAYLVLPTDKLA
jgi:hypothetical protein